MNAPEARLGRGITSLALSLGTFMQVLDTTIANVSIPTIAGNLGVSADQGTWVITSFAVSNGVSVPLTGWLMQRYGLVRTFVASILAFTVASFLCGIAWSLPTLVLFRVLQGAVSGPMIPGSQALLLALFPPEKKGTALAIWSMTTLVAPICGPILGGYISDNYTWPWIFFINLPVGLFAAAVCWQSLGKQAEATRKLPIDRVGLGLLIVWVGSLQIMLDKGKDLDWFSNPFIVVMALTAAIGLAAWLIWELTEAHPIVDLSLFRSRNFTIGVTCVCLGYGVMFGNLVLLPLWLQTQVNYTATWAGLVAAPAGAVAIVVSLLIGRGFARIDPRYFATLSFAAFALSFWMRVQYTQDSTFWVFVAPLLLQGVGMGGFFIALVAIVLAGLPQQRVPAASGILNFMRITAGGFAASITTTAWDRREALHQSRLADVTTVYDAPMQQALSQLSRIGLSPDQATAYVARTLEQQAYLLSSLDYFWISTLLILPLLVMVWFTSKPQAGAAPAVAAGD